MHLFRRKDISPRCESIAGFERIRIALKSLAPSANAPGIALRTVDAILTGGKRLEGDVLACEPNDSKIRYCAHLCRAL